jgi:hypothetical protein
MVVAICCRLPPGIARLQPDVHSAAVDLHDTSCFLRVRVACALMVHHV